MQKKKQPRSLDNNVKNQNLGILIHTPNSIFEKLNVV